MSYYVMPRITQDAEFAGRLFNCFLIRDPMASIVSYHKLDPDMTLDEIGLEAQWLHFTYLSELTGSEPLVIEAEDIRADPRGVIGTLWDRAGLPFIDSAFDWSGSEPSDWKQVAGWHDDVVSSRGISKISPDEKRVGEQEFKKNCANHSHLLKYYLHHVSFYNELKRKILP